MSRTAMVKTPNKNTDTRGDARRAIIIKAAIEAFAEKGFTAASTRDIARRAKTDQGLVTYHFPNKDALWRAAADQIFGELAERLQEQVNNADFSDPKERARSGIREFVRQSAKHPEVFRFMVDEGNIDDDRMRWLVDTHLKPRFEFMLTAGVVGVTELEATLAPHAFYALAGAGSFIFAVSPACKRLTGLDPNKRKVIDAHADYLANLMIP